MSAERKMKRGGGGAQQGTGSSHDSRNGGRSPTGDPYGAFLGAIDPK
jgi:hypothetical protein